ncbi:MAG: DUF692 family multinuclear iron-containing protein [Vicinamibacterales bacterium]
MVSDRPRVFGVCYDSRFDPWIEDHAIDVGCVEVQAEHFYTSTPHRLRWLAARSPLIVRCSSLSLGGPDPVDERQLASCAAVLRDADALWLTHPLGFSRAGEIDLGMNIPISLTAPNLDLVIDRINDVVERCGRQLLIENGSSRLTVSGTLVETEFLNRLCARSASKLLIDLSALCIDGRRHRFTPTSWLDDIDPQQIAQLRVVSPMDSIDPAAPAPTLDEQFSLVARVLTRARPQAIVLAAPRGPLDVVARALAQLRAVATNGGDADRRAAL